MRQRDANEFACVYGIESNKTSFYFFNHISIHFKTIIMNLKTRLKCSLILLAAMLLFPRLLFAQLTVTHAMSPYTISSAGTYGAITVDGTGGGATLIINGGTGSLMSVNCSSITIKNGEHLK